MSNNDQATTVLLPAASIAVFSHDRATVASAEALAQDWRFARVKLEIVQGDVETATQTYQAKGSPDIIVIQTDTTDETFTAKLEHLAGHLSEGTAAIVVGPVNDVYLYRRLIEMGVSDYLVKPLNVSILGDVIAKTLLAKGGTSGSRLIALVGAKGGVGTTAIAQAMAWGMSEIMGEKTLLMDVAGGWSTLSVGMGFEPATTMREAARAAASSDEDSLKRMMMHVSDKLDVMASGADVLLEKTIGAEQLEQILSMVMVKHPLVLVDLSAAKPSLKEVILTRANNIIIVATPTLPALRVARSLFQEIKEMRGGAGENVTLLLNMQGASPAMEISKADIEKAVELSPSASVPFNPKVFVRYESEGKKIIADKEGRSIVENILLPLIQKSSAPVSLEDKPGLLGGLFKKGKKG